MCGIVGYTGPHQASPILVAGLLRLEYRGYDSAGLALLDADQLDVRKRAGRVRHRVDESEARGRDNRRVCGLRGHTSAHEATDKAQHREIENPSHASTPWK